MADLHFGGDRRELRAAVAEFVVERRAAQVGALVVPVLVVGAAAVRAVVRVGSGVQLLDAVALALQRGFLGLGAKESLAASGHTSSFTDFAASDRWYQRC